MSDTEAAEYWRIQHGVAWDALLRMRVQAKGYEGLVTRLTRERDEARAYAESLREAVREDVPATHGSVSESVDESASKADARMGTEGSTPSAPTSQSGFESPVSYPMNDPTPEETADAVWGPGNWVRCDPCPSNDNHVSIHARDFHDHYEHPSGTLTRVERPRTAGPGEMYCAAHFQGRDHPRPWPWRCELPQGHQGRHGVPRFDAWGPEET